MKRTIVWNRDVRSEVIGGLILTIVLAVLGTTYGMAIRWIPAFKKGANQAMSLAMGSSYIPNWILLIALIALGTWIAVPAVFIWRRIPLARNRNANWLSYNADEFFGIQWRWQYGRNAHPVNFRPFCVTCGDPLYFETQTSYSNVNQISYRCDKCPWQHSGLSKTKERLEAELAQLVVSRRNEIRVQSTAA